MDHIRTTSEAGAKSFNLAGLLAGLNGPLGSANKLFASLLGQDDAAPILAKMQEKVASPNRTAKNDADKNTIWEVFPKQTLSLLKHVTERLRAYEKAQVKDKDTPVKFVEDVAQRHEDAARVVVAPGNASPAVKETQPIVKECETKCDEDAMVFKELPPSNDNAVEDEDTAELDIATAALLGALNQTAPQPLPLPTADLPETLAPIAEAPITAPSNDNQDQDNTKELSSLIDDLEELTDLIEKRLQALLNIQNKDCAAPIKTNAAPVVTPASTIAPQVAAPQSAFDIAATPTDETPMAEAAPPSQGKSESAPAHGVAGILTQLLQVVQAIEQRLAGETAFARTDVVATKANTKITSETLTLDQQLKIDIKSLMDAVKAQMDAAKKSSMPTNPVDVAENVSAETPLPTATQETPKALPPVAETAKRADVPQDDFLNLFTSKTDAPTPNSSYAPSQGGAVIASDGKGATTDFEFDAKTGQNNARYTPASPENSNLAGASSGATSPYSFASQLSATRALNGGATGLPSAVEQVKLQLHRAVKGGNDQMSIQLRPAELGRIDIKLNFSTDGKVHGTVVADNPATLDMLLKDVRGLERALQEAGLRADPGSLQFSLGGQTGNSSGRMPGDSSQPSKNNQAGAQLDEPEAATAEAGEVWYVTPSRVNLKV